MMAPKHTGLAWGCIVNPVSHRPFVTSCMPLLALAAGVSGVHG